MPRGDRSKKLDVDVVDSFVLITFGGRNPANHVRLAVYPIIYDGLYKSQLVSRISSINSIMLSASEISSDKKHVTCEAVDVNFSLQVGM